MPRAYRWWAVLGLAVLLLACEQVGASASHPGPGAGARKGKGKGKRRARPPAPVAIAHARTGTIASHHVTTATLEPEKIAPVLARLKGVVRRIDREEGDTVRAGQPLLVIEGAEYRLQVAKAAAQTARLRDQRVRLEGMVSKALVPAEELEVTRHELAAAEAEEEMARLDLSRTTVRAPFAGRVVRRLVDVGQTVTDGTPLFEVADLSPLLARVHVPARRFRSLAADQPVELSLDSTGARMRGVIALVSPVIDPATGTIKLTVEIPQYPEGTRPGDFAEIRIVTETHERAVLVPRGAVLEERKERVVFMAQGDKAVRRKVVTGLEHAGAIEILEGLRPGDPVVIKGQHSLEDGAPIKILESGQD